MPHPAHVHHSLSIKFPQRWHTHPRGFLLSVAESEDSDLMDLLGGFLGAVVGRGGALRVEGVDAGGCKDENFEAWRSVPQASHKR